MRLVSILAQFEIARLLLLLGLRNLSFVLLWHHIVYALYLLEVLQKLLVFHRDHLLGYALDVLHVVHSLRILLLQYHGLIVRCGGTVLDER